MYMLCTYLNSHTRNFVDNFNVNAQIKDLLELKMGQFV